MTEEELYLDGTLKVVGNVIRRAKIGRAHV